MRTFPEQATPACAVEPVDRKTIGAGVLTRGSDHLVRIVRDGTVDRRVDRRRVLLPDAAKPERSPQAEGATR